MSEARRRRLVLVFHSAHDEGGMERAFAELIRRAQKEFEVVVIASELAPNLAALVDWRRAPVPPRPAPARFLLFYVLGGLRLWWERRADDLVHTCGAIVPNRADVAWVQFCHAGFVATHGWTAADGRPFLRRMNTAIAGIVGHTAERWSYGRGRIAVLGAVSNGVARELARAYPDATVVLSPNGVDPNHFRPDQRIRAEVRGAYGVVEEELLVLFVGGDWHHKGLAVVLEALCWVPRSRLWVVGRGDEAAFATRAEQLGVGERVTFLGSQTDVARYYQAADVFALPSRYETFSLVAYEAAACGLPVVATRVHGVDELIGDDQAGLIVDRSGKAFAHALQALAADPERRRRMGRTARRRAKSFTWDATTTAILDLYSKLFEHDGVVEEAAA